MRFPAFLKDPAGRFLCRKWHPALPGAGEEPVGSGRPHPGPGQNVSLPCGENSCAGDEPFQPELQDLEFMADPSY
jgi:hypothetical protein